MAGVRRKRLAPPGLRKGQVTGDQGDEAKARISGLHAHGCNQCSARYTDGCRYPHVNGLCQDCRGTTYGRPSWDRHFDPRTCCRRHSEPAGLRERETYSLGGEGRWWICSTCKRTHPYDPRTNGTGDLP